MVTGENVPWLALKNLFREARSLPTESRCRLLQNLHPDLSTELENLLVQDAPSRDLVATLIQTGIDDCLNDRPGARSNVYRLLDTLNEIRRTTTRE